MTPLAQYQDLLTRYVQSDGDVGYAAWHESAADTVALHAVLRAWLAESPESNPQAFAGVAHRLGYWLNLYNALVIREVVGRWPIASVKDVKPTLLSKAIPLKGFFVDLRFDVAGQSMSLMQIENKVIRAQFKDARIHFALNCGSAACPVLRPSVFDGDALDLQLDEASREFVNNGESVEVEPSTKAVWLSKIFKWYRGDFETHAQNDASIEGATVLDFAAYYASEALATALQTAKREGYRVRYRDYDWSVNAAKP